MSRGGRLRVLHLIYDDADNPWLGGGGARRVWEIYRRLTDRVDACVASGAFPGGRDETREGVRFRRLGSPRSYALSRLGYVAAANRLLARGEYDVAVYDYSVYTPLRVPRGAPVGTVVHMLQGESAAQRWGRVGGALLRAAERRLIGQTRQVCVTSRWLERRAAAMLPPDRRYWVIGSGIDDALFELPRAEGGYVLFYGRFDLFQKGLDVLLDSFALLGERRPALRLVVAGRGKDEARLARLAAEHPFAERIELRAGISHAERDRLFRGARLLLMPSRLEGLPMAPAEAMAAGLPVVAADVGALAEVVQPPAGGRLVPPDDAAALADAAAALLADDALRARTSASAREAADRFRWARVAERHLEFLHAVRTDS